MIIDLIPVRDGTGTHDCWPCRGPLESKKAFKDWLAEGHQAWRDEIEVVAMDGSTGCKTAAAEEQPGAVSVMDLCPVVRLAGDALTSAGAGSSRTCTVIGAVRATRCAQRCGPCTLEPTC